MHTCMRGAHGRKLSFASRALAAARYLQLHPGEPSQLYLANARTRARMLMMGDPRARGRRVVVSCPEAPPVCRGASERMR